ncbi:hypothetical protein V8C35DRAFT_326143 [Trichoderma chlorosporum]
MGLPQKLCLPEGLLTTRHDEAITVLGRLIEENHRQNALLYEEVLHNHLQHGLLAAYCLGGGDVRLRAIFFEESKELERRAKTKSGETMTEEVLDTFLGHRERQFDFITYFEQQHLISSESVQKTLQYWILDRSKQFLPGFVGGYGHPLIMFADSVELGSSTLAFDALALTATDWSPLADLIMMDLPMPKNFSNSLMDILDKIRIDPSFTGVVSGSGIEHIADILQNGPAMAAVIKYLSIGDAYLSRPEFNLQVTREMVEIALSLLVCTHAPGMPAFDFYLSHNLTFVNSLRILLPVFEYAVHIMRVFGATMQNMEPLLLSAAHKFVQDFNGWTGFGAS